MKISIINENEIFLNYLNTDTSEEMNIPSLNEGYSLMYGNDKNNLKTITVDNLKNIFHENKQKYIIYINSLNFDKLTFDVTAYNKSNELINDYDFSNNFIFSENCIKNDQINFSIFNDEKYFENLPKKIFLNTLYENVNKTVNDKKYEKTLALNFLDKKLDDFLIDENINDINFPELTDRDINNFDIDNKINLPDLTDFNVKTINFPDLNYISIDTNFNINEINIDFELDYKINELNLPKISIDQINDFDDFDTIITNFKILNVPTIPNLKFNNLIVPNILSESFASLNTPNLSILNLNFSNIPDASLLSSSNKINVPNILNENFTNICIPNVKADSFCNLRLPDIDVDELKNFNSPNISVDFFNDISTPKINTENFKEIIFNDIKIPDFSYNLITITIPNCQVSNINDMKVPDDLKYEFKSIEIDQTFNDVNNIIENIGSFNVNFKNITLPDTSICLTSGLVINDICIPNIQNEVKTITIPSLQIEQINELSIPNIPIFRFRSFETPQIVDGLINTLTIPVIDDLQICDLNVPKINKTVNYINIPETSFNTNFNIPTFNDKIDAKLKSIEIPSYDEINFSLNNINVPDISSGLFKTLTINEIDDNNISPLKLPDINFDVNFDNLHFNYVFPSISSSYTDKTEKLLNLEDKINELEDKIKLIPFYFDVELDIRVNKWHVEIPYYGMVNEEYETICECSNPDADIIYDENGIETGCSDGSELICDTIKIEGSGYAGILGAYCNNLVGDEHIFIATTELWENSEEFGYWVKDSCENCLLARSYYTKINEVILSSLYDRSCYLTLNEYKSANHDPTNHDKPGHVIKEVRSDVGFSYSYMSAPGDSSADDYVGDTADYCDIYFKCVDFKIKRNSKTPKKLIGIQLKFTRKIIKEKYNNDNGSDWSHPPTYTRNENVTEEIFEFYFDENKMSSTGILKKEFNPLTDVSLVSLGDGYNQEDPCYSPDILPHGRSTDIEWKQESEETTVTILSGIWEN
jgi:hypothetical protein